MERQHIFDNPKNVTRLLATFFTIVVLLLAIDVVYIVAANHHLIERHMVFQWEGWWGFYCFFGFVACVVLVLVSKYVLRPLTMRKENYYD